MFLGLYLGVLFIMTGYNTFLFLVLRDKGYLYYVLFMVSLLSIEVLQRHLPQRFLWPDQVWLNSGVALIPVATIVFIFLLRFAASFLMSKINAPKLHPAFLVLQTGLCITALLFLLLSKTILFLVLWLVLILVCVAVVLITGLFVWKRGYRPARYFVTALLMLLVAVFISVLSVLGFVPKSYTEHVVHTGVVAMAFLMSLALADRINTIKHEREEAQAEVVRKQQEMLQLKDNFAATLQKHNDDLKRNIAEREQAEAEIRLLNNELESRVDERTAALRLANKELETFAYTVSHDLRGPLRAINGFAATLQEEYDRVLDDAGRAYLQRLQMAGMRMSGLIDHLLQLSRLIRTQMRLEIVDLSALAVDIVEELRAAFPERRVEFSVDPELKTLGDAKLLRVALENLLGNAWKFTEHRDPAVVAFRSLRVNGGLKLQITDNGAGFDMALAQKLFQPFQRLHRDDEFEGTGIGLATVSRIIKRHGGCIWAESEPGKGATFYFTLATSPLADPDAVARSAILVNAIGGKK
jgi:signal transduction histidine kinase